MICLVIHRHTWHKSEALIKVVVDLITAKIMMLNEIDHEIASISILLWIGHLIIVWQRLYECKHIEPRILNSTLG